VESQIFNGGYSSYIEELCCGAAKRRGVGGVMKVEWPGDSSYVLRENRMMCCPDCPGNLVLFLF